MDSCFPDCWKVSLVVPVFKNLGERSTAKNYGPVSLLSVVSKVNEKLANNRIVDHLKTCGLFSDFQFGFRSSQSTGDLLIVACDRVVCDVNVLYINDLSDDAIFDIAIYADDTTLYSKCDQASDLWQQLELWQQLLNLNQIYETLWNGAKSGLLISMLVLFDRSNNTGSIDVKMDGPAIKEKSSFKMLGLTFSSKLD